MMEEYFENNVMLKFYWEQEHPQLMVAIQIRRETIPLSQVFVTAGGSWKQPRKL